MRGAPQVEFSGGWCSRQISNPNQLSNGQTIQNPDPSKGTKSRPPGKSKAGPPATSKLTFHPFPKANAPREHHEFSGFRTPAVFKSWAAACITGYYASLQDFVS